MLLKNLRNGDKCVFLPRDSKTIYTIKDGYLYWHSNNDKSRRENSYPMDTYLNREVVKITDTFDLITALQKMKEGKKVRAIHWSKNQYSSAISGTIYNQDGNVTSLVKIGDLNEQWEEFQEPKIVEVKLNAEYTAKVSSQDITVGCQSFPHSKIEELAKAIKEVTQ